MIKVRTPGSINEALEAKNIQSAVATPAAQSELATPWVGPTQFTRDV